MDNDMGRLHDHLSVDYDRETEIEIWHIAAEEGVDFPEAKRRWQERQNVPFVYDDGYEFIEPF